MSEPVFKHIASFGARAVALAIDFALLAAIHLIMFFLLAGRLLNEVVHLELLAILTAYSWFVVVFFVSFVFLHMVYFTMFHALSGQTIGKMIMNIRVVTQDNGQVPPSLAFLRWTGYILSLVPFASGFLWSAVDKDHCAWHDRLAQTRVVSAEMT
jgi:uncharacterized RDD family membrane protein YckC